MGRDAVRVRDAETRAQRDARGDHRVLPRSSRPFQGAQDRGLWAVAQDLDRQGAKVPASRAGEKPALSVRVVPNDAAARVPQWRLLCGVSGVSDREWFVRPASAGHFPALGLAQGSDAGPEAPRYGLATAWHLLWEADECTTDLMLTPIGPPLQEGYARVRRDLFENP